MAEETTLNALRLNVELEEEKIKPAGCGTSWKCHLSKTCARAHQRFSSGPWNIKGTRNAVCGSYIDMTPQLVAEKLEASNDVIQGPRSGPAGMEG